MQSERNPDDFSAETVRHLATQLLCSDPTERIEAADKILQYGQNYLPVLLVCCAAAKQMVDASLGRGGGFSSRRSASARTRRMSGAERMRAGTLAGVGSTCTGQSNKFPAPPKRGDIKGFLEAFVRRGAPRLELAALQATLERKVFALVAEHNVSVDQNYLRLVCGSAVRVLGDVRKTEHTFIAIERQDLLFREPEDPDLEIGSYPQAVSCGAGEQRRALPDAPACSLPIGYFVIPVASQIGEWDGAPLLEDIAERGGKGRYGEFKSQYSTLGLPELNPEITHTAQRSVMQLNRFGFERCRQVANIVLVNSREELARKYIELLPNAPPVLKPAANRKRRGGPEV